MKGVLFLDFDGVLNSVQSEILNEKNEWEQRVFGPDDSYGLVIDRQLCKVFNKLMQYVPDTKIVISSSWRTQYELYEIIDILNDNGFKYTENIIGITPTTYKTRGDDIKDYCETHSITNYCILDDGTDMLPEQKNRFVLINAIIGLTILDIFEAVRILDPYNDVLKKYEYVSE